MTSNIEELAEDSGDRIVSEIWKALGGPPATLESLVFVGKGNLPSVFPVTSFASAAVAAAALSIEELLSEDLSAAPEATIERRFASLRFGWSIRPIGWKMPEAWEPIAADHRTMDGWIRLHERSTSSRRS